MFTIPSVHGAAQLFHVPRRSWREWPPFHWNHTKLGHYFSRTSWTLAEHSEIMLWSWFPYVNSVAFQDLCQCKFQHIWVQAQTNLAQHHGWPLNVPFSTTTPIHFALTFFSHFSVSVCLFLFACMSLNNVATMYKNCPVSFKNIIQLSSSHPQCAPQSPPHSAHLALSSSLLILHFPLCCPCYLCWLYWHPRIIPIHSSKPIFGPLGWQMNLPTPFEAFILSANSSLKLLHQIVCTKMPSWKGN